MKIKTIAHALAAIGELLNDKDLLMATLSGLDNDYETIISLITYQMDEINIEKVQSLLLMLELGALAAFNPLKKLITHPSKSLTNHWLTHHNTNS